MDNFISELARCLRQELPGMSAHLGMAPPHRKTELQDLALRKDATRSSVLILFYTRDNQPYVVFIKRPEYNGVHSGQIAFPGGRWEKTDKSLYHTALRESNEEIGLQTHAVEYLGKLSDLYVPPSNYLISPFVGFYKGNPNFVPDPKEVARILEIPFNFFLQPNAIQDTTIVLSSDFRLDCPAFVFEQETIWGATAMILHELIVLWKTIV